jgi:tol-pal system protein YbgF
VTRLLLGLQLVGLAGCAGASSDASLQDLRARLTEAQHKEADGRRRIDELENRVFLMNDQLESQRVASAASRTPRLPVVTLRPSEDALRPGAHGDDADPRDEARDESRDEISFTGAARSSDARHVRPQLRGDGEGGVSAREPRHVSRPPAEPGVRLVAQRGGDSLGVAPAPPIPKSTAAPAAPERVDAPLSAEPIGAYRAAYAELAAGRYDEAEQKLRAFVRRYPRHDYADNAQYWLGECFYARHRYAEAAVEFRAAVAKYPVGNKAPDSLLKLAYSLLSLGDRAEARRLLEELPGNYPRSEAARLATQKLAELGGRAPSTASPTAPEDAR